MHVKGFAAPETRAAIERAHLLMEKAQALGESLEDAMLSFSVIYGFWSLNYLAFNGDAMRGHAAQFLALAEREGAPGTLMAGHRLMATSLLYMGDVAGSRAHLDRAMEFYDPTVHRPLGTRFGQDIGVAVLFYRSWAYWMFGYPEAALANASHALKDAREIGQAATLLPALCLTGFTYIFCGDYDTANARSDEATSLADEKGAALWKAWGTMNQGWTLALTGKSLNAVQTILSGISAWHATGATVLMPCWLSNLAWAYAQRGQFDDAKQCTTEALKLVETTKETMFEAEVHRTAGQIALLSPKPDATKAEAYFERALAVAREQQAKSWELRAAMSLARLWRDQGKPQQARELLARVYGWFTEGFDTRDLKEAKALLDELYA